MNLMFCGAVSFNQPLASWDVSHVTDMEAMFMDAAAFNQPLDTWDVRHVRHMLDMFKGATSFNQLLSSWNLSPRYERHVLMGGQISPATSLVG
jgi:hypothetical protein